VSALAGGLGKIPSSLPVLASVVSLFTGGLADAIVGVAGALSVITTALPPSVLQGIAVGNALGTIDLAGGAPSWCPRPSARSAPAGSTGGRCIVGGAVADGHDISLSGRARARHRPAVARGARPRDHAGQPELIEAAL
jgi:hypothetical protein